MNHCTKFDKKRTIFAKIDGILHEKISAEDAPRNPKRVAVSSPEKVVVMVAYRGR